MLLQGLAATAMAGKVDPVHQHGGLAIRGYDPVACYQQSAPVKGSWQFSFQWQGTTWLFASAENRDRFQAEPESYAPQYGRYCAYAVSKGRTASIDSEAWKIVDGRLYFDYSKGVRKKWEQDVPGNIVKAKESARSSQMKGPLRLSERTRSQRMGPLRNTQVHLVTFNSARASLADTLGS